jgi:thiopeptide-type bacteriocin biosynthesis protein
MRPSSRYAPLEACIIRTSLLSVKDNSLVIPDDPNDIAALRDYLANVASDPVIRDAIDVSSTSLAAVLDKIANGKDVRPAQLRRAAFSATRYLSRMIHRPTPFGLLAGIGAARFADTANIPDDINFRKYVRVDMGWLMEVLHPLETDDAVLPRLWLIKNDLCSLRDDRLIIPDMTPSKDGDQTGEQEHSIRNTAAVRCALDACATIPQNLDDLVRRLLIAFADADRNVAVVLIKQLIERGFLLTDLRPPLTTPDPLRHVLEKLSYSPEVPAYRPLKEIAQLLEEYAASPVGAGRVSWLTATRAMERLYSSGRPAVHVDTAVDARFEIPREVARELDHAISFAWSATADGTAPRDVLSGYRQAFIERYGAGTLVPIKELLDPNIGLGAPAGYLIPPSGRRHAAEARAEPTERDMQLLELAQHACMRGEHQVVIDQALAEQLICRTGATTSYIEVCAELIAESEETLNGGAFRLVLENSLTRPGAFFGRFLHLYPHLDEVVGDLAAEVTGAGAESTPTQIIAQTLQYRHNNLAQVPQLTQQGLHIGVFAGRRSADVHGLDDIAIGATHERMYAVSTRSRRELIPLPFNALNSLTSVANAVRLLHEIGLTRTPPWNPWSWGLAERLPFLPRIQYGRTVLHAARWRLPGDLLDPAATWSEWQHRWDRWRVRWEVPDTVYAAKGDHRLKLSFNSEASLQLFRALVLKDPTTVIQEDAGNDIPSRGLAGGRSTEIAVALRPRQEPKIAASPTPYRIAVHSQQPVYQPGGEWLYAKLYSAPARHDELLVAHFPTLLDQIKGLYDRWFFIRYEENGPHLRLRFHGDPHALNSGVLPVLNGWSSRLVAAGMASRLVLDTYHPEYGRYGGRQIMEYAERAFQADSVSVMEQLHMREAAGLETPIELLAAANVLDLAQALDPAGWRRWLLERYPKNNHHRFFQGHRGIALDLLSPETGWASLKGFPGGATLLQSWKMRAPTIAEYGIAVRSEVRDGRLGSTMEMFGGLLHMHNNRLGIGRETESSAYAVARGVVQVRLDQERRKAR